LVSDVVTVTPSWRRSLYAAWRIFLFVLIALGIGAVLGGIVLAVLHFSGTKISAVSRSAIRTIQAPQLLAGEVLAFIGLVSSTALMARWEGRTLADFGFPWRRLFTLPFWIGLGTGFIAIVCVVVAMILCGTAHVTGLATNGPALVVQAALWALTFLIVAIVEEVGFRGYPQFTLAANVGFWPGALAMTLLFTLLHVGNAGESPVGVAGVFAVGLLFCFALRRFGDLRWPIGFHAAWDWGQTCFFGTRDSGMFASGSILRTETSGPSLLSGGSAGPEATIFALIALGATAAVIYRCRVSRTVSSGLP
jgi:hypothetical protein